MMNNFMNGMFGKIGSGMCKLSMSGNIAVKTSNGYKSYNIKSGKLTNCGNFVFPGVDENFFFVIPTNKVAKGDIILVNGKPKCVIEADKTKITVINYEDSTVETILPERHVFMGNTYFYGKIVSMFGSNLGKDKNSANKIFKYMMMSQMMNGAAGTGTGTDSNPMNAGTKIESWRMLWRKIYISICSNKYWNCWRSNLFLWREIYISEFYIGGSK